MVSNFNFFYHRDADLRQGAKEARLREGGSRRGERDSDEEQSGEPGRGHAHDSLLETGLGLVRELGSAAPDISRGLSLLRPRRRRGTGEGSDSEPGGEVGTQPHRHVMVKFQGNVHWMQVVFLEILHCSAADLLPNCWLAPRCAFYLRSNQMFLFALLKSSLVGTSNTRTDNHVLSHDSHYSLIFILFCFACSVVQLMLNLVF